MYLCGAVFYYFFGSGELQQCNCPRVEVHELKRRENDTTVWRGREMTIDEHSRIRFFFSVVSEHER